jgi:SAM-dependent methyltransferase
MNADVLPLLASPDTHEAVSLIDPVRDSRGIREGTLQTPSGRRYPIVDYIPRFVDQESYAESFGKEWNIFHKTQVDSANGTTMSRTRFQGLTGVTPEELRGKRVLEAGCGSGRFLEVLANAGADVFGVDMSAAVHVSRDNVPKATVVQADLTKLPFQEGTFDFIYSFGVLMCTPDTEESFRSLLPYLKPGGRICIWVYGYRGPKWIPRPYQVYGAVAKRLPLPMLMRAIDAYTAAALPLGRLPVVGGAFRLVMPVSDLTQKKKGEDGWDNGKEPPAELVREWARLNMFDAWTPEYCRQHDFGEVTSWFERAGLVDIQQSDTRVAVIGRKPA